ncbi:MAG TPA: PHP domain-containing protein [Vicinamibacterales bacterium]
MRLLDSIRGDLNITAAGLLQDMAIVQASERSRFGYKRAARAIASAIDTSVRDLVEAASLREVPYIGAASERIIVELVRTGASATVEAAVRASSRGAEVEKRRGYRRAYLSRHTMRRALDAALGRSIVSATAYRGDLQMHSTWSDGVESVRSLAEAADALGWTRIGVTDHSYGLPIARGMSMEAAARQHDEIERVNEDLGGRVRVYHGVEANILADGLLDLTEDERGRFDYVVASPHSALRKEIDQTSRMINAVTLRRVAILGHPQGRMYNTRPGVSADWKRVFAEAARRGVAIEIDGNWHRQDIDYELAALALDAGCVFALDSDAHSIGELPFTDYSIAHARVAGVPADRVVNCWDQGKFESWLTERAGKRTTSPARRKSAGNFEQ